MYVSTLAGEEQAAGFPIIMGRAAHAARLARQAQPGVHLVGVRAVQHHLAGLPGEGDGIPHDGRGAPVVALGPAFRGVGPRRLLDLVGLGRVVVGGGEGVEAAHLRAAVGDAGVDVAVMVHDGGQGLGSFAQRGRLPHHFQGLLIVGVNHGGADLVHLGGAGDEDFPVAGADDGEELTAAGAVALVQDLAGAFIQLEKGALGGGQDNFNRFRNRILHIFNHDKNEVA